MNVRFFLVALGLLLVRPAHGDELQGTSKVLSAIQEQARKAVDARPPGEVTNLGEWKRELEAFKSTRESAKPAEQAAQWLKLLDQLKALHEEALPSGAGYESQREFTNWLAAAPPPAAWPEFQKLIEGREIPTDAQGALSAHGARLFAHLLNNNQEAVAADREALAQAREAVVQQGGVLPREDDDWEYRHQITHALPHAALSGEPEDIEAAFEKQLAENNSWIMIPDLVAMLGEERATPLVKKAILGKSGSFFGRLLGKESSAQIYIEGEETIKLAQTIARANPEGLRGPLWQLVRTPEDAPVYEALIKKFGDATPWGMRDAAHRHAANCYLAHLMDSDQAEKVQQALAARLLNLVGEDQWMRDNDMLGSEESRAVLLDEARCPKLYAALDALMTDHLQHFPWANYFEAAEKCDQEDAALKRAQVILNDEKTTMSARCALADKLFRACLAQELVDEAVTLLRQYLAKREAAGPAETTPSDLESPVAYALRIAELGRLVGNAEWEREGLDLAIELLASAPEAEFVRIATEHQSSVKRLLAADRGAEAEQLLARSLARWAARMEATSDGIYSSFSRDLLVALAAVYDSADRYADVVELLEKAPWWNERELAGIANSEFGDMPLGVYAARALAQQNRPDEAKQVLLALIDAQPGFDPPYEMLLALDAPGAIALFEKSIASDPFQERPLIWKAKYLLNEGKTAEAGKVIREAILIDPSDGEQGKERRMLAYAVLAEVMELEGDTEGAKTFRKAVAAIRQSEKADDYKAAGLDRRARALYKEALDLFSDAYCIQSRLAIQLYEAGLTEEAAKHYQRAFELMPDSFGMIESHCFGCEGAFSGKMAQDLAEKVFEGLVKKHPEKPQVHYLLGYLREAQYRPQDAIKHYREAVRLAPQYLNAWNKLVSLLAHDPSPEAQAELDKAVQAQIRLDPLGRHCSPEVDEVHDLAAIWTLLDEAGKHYSPPPQELLKLAGSAEWMEEQQKRMVEKTRAAAEDGMDLFSYDMHYNPFDSGYMTGSFSGSFSRSTPVKPGAALARNKRLLETQTLLLREQ